jgi:hypothetical protein
MEPLVALSIAGTIVQFVDFGSKLLKGGRELYTSKTRTLKTNEELELITTDLEGVIKKFRELACSLETRSKHMTQPPQEELSSLESLCDEASSVAEELVTRLKGLKTRKSSNLACNSIRQAVRLAWSKQELANLTARFVRFKDALDSHILLSIGQGKNIHEIITMLLDTDYVVRDKIDAEVLRTSTRFDVLDQQTQNIVTSLARCSQASSFEITSTLMQLFRRIEIANRVEHKRTRKAILAAQKQDRESERQASKDTSNPKDQEEDVAGVIPSIEILSVSDAEESELRTAIQVRILEGLQYPTMTNRYEKSKTLTLKPLNVHSAKRGRRMYRGVACQTGSGQVEAFIGSVAKLDRENPA